MPVGFGVSDGLTIIVGSFSGNWAVGIALAASRAVAVWSAVGGTGSVVDSVFFADSTDGDWVTGVTVEQAVPMNKTMSKHAI